MIRLNFHASESVTDQVKRRGPSISDNIREALSRYYRLLDEARESIGGKFSAGELGLLCDLSNGTIWEAHSLDMMDTQVRDAEDDYFTRWEVDRKSLITKLHGLSLTQYAALVDAVERYWEASRTGMSVDHTRILEG